MHLKSYQVTLKTLTPVFIGSGREINKKEYLFLTQQKVAVMDPYKLYTVLKQRGKAAEFEKYLIGNGPDSRIPLAAWLREQKLSVNQVSDAIKYQVYCGDSIRRDGKRMQVLECMKNPYNEPYIPGSSLKGMLRTILLSYLISQSPKEYASFALDIDKEVRSDKKAKRNSFLARNIGTIETKAFHTLHRTDPSKGGKEIDASNAVNDVFQGFVVSDSEPLSTDDLVFCQKIDVNEKKEEHSLPILRECIADGCEIHFTITVDTSICHFDDVFIAKAISYFSEQYYNRFSGKFSKEKPKSNQVWLGGGTGFATKTVINSLFDNINSVYVTSKIFEKTNVPRNHGHQFDVKKGISPHILKCTYNAGRLEQMGSCEFFMNPLT